MMPQQDLLLCQRRCYGTSTLCQTQDDNQDSAATGSSSSATVDVEWLEVRRLMEQATALYQKNLDSTPMSLPQLQLALADLEREQAEPSFWDESNSPRAQTVNRLVSQYSRMQTRLQQWQQWHDDAHAALEMLQDDSAGSAAVLSVDERTMLQDECQDAVQRLWDDLQAYELDLLLSGPYDDSAARVVVTAGAGGTEANDWVADLVRMYQRHCADTGMFECVTEDAQPGDKTGYKSVDLLISGPKAYGWFQGEKGAHRLVRLSPFNAKNLRQTTFAGVDVAPADLLTAVQDADLEIPDADLEITTMRSGGKGGQNVNKVNSAVRIKHLPTGLQVKCTQERAQHQNKQLAMQRLRAQLLAIAQEQRVQDVSQISGDAVQASWGAQIRNYVLHPYKLVKDARTQWETSRAVAFIDGDNGLLHDCMSAHLRYRAKQQQEQAREEEAEGEKAQK